MLGLLQAPCQKGIHGQLQKMVHGTRQAEIYI